MIVDLVDRCAPRSLDAVDSILDFFECVSVVDGKESTNVFKQESIGSGFLEIIDDPESIEARSSSKPSRSPSEE